MPAQLWRVSTVISLCTPLKKHESFPNQNLFKGNDEKVSEAHRQILEYIRGIREHFPEFSGQIFNSACVSAEKEIYLW
jgi:hypothetical protein